MECCPAAILAADVVGYTRLISEDENEHNTALPVLREGDREPLIADHGDG